MTNDRRRTATRIRLAAVAAAATALVSCSKGDKAFQPPPVPVVTMEASVRTIPYEVQSIGTAEAYNTVSIRSQVGGVVSRVYFKEGDPVRKGARLFLVDEAPYRAALQAARAQLVRDRVTAANLEERLKRYDELIKKDYITEQEHSDMQANLEAMQATVRADSANVESARLNLDYCSIESPIDGRVGTRMIDEGNVVKANGDSPMVVIHQIRPIRVQFTVPQQYLTRLLKYSASQKLRVLATTADEDSTVHEGYLTFVDNAVDVATGTIMLKAEFANEDGMLWPGQFVNVTLILTQIEDAIVVPSQAVGTGQDGDFIFVVKPDATVEMRSVRVRYRLNNDTVLESGVEAGEKVVVDGQLRLRPGSRVVEKAPVSEGEASTS
jgi:multidrug efflux system membrane fusion protein